MGCTVVYSPSRTPRRDLYPGYDAVITICLGYGTTAPSDFL